MVQYQEKKTPKKIIINVFKNIGSNFRDNEYLERIPYIVIYFERHPPHSHLSHCT